MRIAFNVFKRGELLKRLPEEAQGVGVRSQAQESELPSPRLTGLEIGDVFIRTGQSQTVTVKSVAAKFYRRFLNGRVMRGKWTEWMKTIVCTPRRERARRWPLAPVPARPSF